MINFNGAQEQKEFNGNGPIPAKSVVKVCMTIRAPGEKSKSNIHPLLTISKKNSNNLYINCEFEVLSGTYEGIKVWSNYVVVGSEKACNISMAFLRAVLEASRGINPADGSQNATAARQLQDWSEFNSMQFPVMVGIKTPEAGDEYINNTIMRAITPDKDQYQVVMNGGEIITDTPIPQIPESSANSGASQTGGYQPPESNSGSYQQPSSNNINQNQSPQSQDIGDTTPSWAQ